MNIHSNNLQQTEFKITETEKKELEKILKEGFDSGGFIPDSNCKIGEIPIICLATKYNYEAWLRCLIQHGADVNAKDTDGNTPLHISINTNNNTFLNYLLQDKANPNIQNKFGHTPLLKAVFNNNTNAIISLVKHRANINQHVNFYSTLGWIIFNSPDHNFSHTKETKEAKEKMLTTLQIVCKLGASLMNVNKWNDTAFHVAVDKEEIDIIITLILHARFNLNFNQFTPLDLIEEHIKILQEILHIKNNKKKTVLDLLTTCNEKYRKEFELLFNKKLPNDFIEFKKIYPNIASISPNNLVRQIYQNYPL